MALNGSRQVDMGLGWRRREGVGGQGLRGWSGSGEQGLGHAGARRNQGVAVSASAGGVVGRAVDQAVAEVKGEVLVKAEGTENRIVPGHVSI